MPNNNAVAVQNPFANAATDDRGNDKPCTGVAQLGADGKLTVTTDMSGIAEALSQGFEHVPAPQNSAGNKSIAYGQGRWKMPDGSKVMVSCSVTLVKPKA